MIKKNLDQLFANVVIFVFVKRSPVPPSAHV